MQRDNRGQGSARGSDDFFGFGDPYAGFPGFANPRSLMSSFFGRDLNDPFLGNSLFGNDAFSNPFFPRPCLFGHDAFNNPFFNRPFGGMFGRTNDAFIEDGAHQAGPSNRGPVIQELSPDEEENANESGNSRNNGSASTEPFVQDPDEEDNAHEPTGRYVRSQNEYDLGQRAQPQSRSFSFQSSTVTYGGANGAYHTKSTTRKVGGDGVIEEEHKEADSTTGKATHRVSRGIREKGHSVTRHLKSGGNVDTIQTLHNLNEDELDNFKKDWEGKAKRHLPGWNQGFDALRSGDHVTSRQAGASGSSSRGWALPSNEQPASADHRRMAGKPNLRNTP